MGDGLRFKGTMSFQIFKPDIPFLGHLCEKSTSSACNCLCSYHFQLYEIDSTRRFCRYYSNCQTAADGNSGPGFQSYRYLHTEYQLRKSLHLDGSFSS